VTSWRVSAGCMCLALALSCSAAPGQPYSAGPAPPATVRSAFVLGADDVITIHATNAPDLSDKPFRIDLAGEIKLPMVGRIRAANLTLEELEAEIAKRLKVYLEDPEVTVTVTEFHSQPVSIMGAVGTPGIHQLEGRKTLIEVLAEAGGLRSDAGATIKITRRLEYGMIPAPNAIEDPAHQFSIAEIDLRSLMQSANPALNILICPHDILSVPHADLIYVIGEVNKAGPVTLTDGQPISVLQAVSSAGGTLRTAAVHNTRILREVPGQTKRTEVHVDVGKMLVGKSDDVPLLAGDILVVPGSTGKHAALRTLEAAVQAGTLVATYGVVH
jgi:polysaccharide biosynthesis/export protein